VLLFSLALRFSGATLVVARIDPSLSLVTYCEVLVGILL